MAVPLVVTMGLFWGISMLGSAARCSGMGLSGESGASPASRNSSDIHSDGVIEHKSVALRSSLSIRVGTVYMPMRSEKGMFDVREGDVVVFPSTIGIKSSSCQPNSSPPVLS